MLRDRIKSRISALRRDKKNIPQTPSVNLPFKKEENPERLYVAKLEPFASAYHRHAYGVYIKGDGTLNGSTLKIKVFATEYQAFTFLKELQNSPTLEKIKIKLFSHPEDKIFLHKGRFVSSDYYNTIYPQLKQFRFKNVEGQDLTNFQFLRTLGFKEEEMNCCE
jgi:hypothetical protein